MKKILSVIVAIALLAQCFIITSAAINEETVFFTEDFSAAGKKTEIQNKQNGWSWKESGAGITDIDILGTAAAPEKGFIDGLRFSSKDWYKGNELALDLPVAVGAEKAANLNGNVHISLDGLFGISSGSIESGSQMYIRIMDTAGVPFCGLLLETNYEFSLVALDSSRTNAVKYQISNTKDAIIDQKKHYDFYVNPTDNTFQFLVDGVKLDSVMQVHGDWIPAATRGDVGPASENDINGVGKVQIGHFWSTWWDYIFIDNLQLSNFVISEPVDFVIKKATVVQKGTENTVIREGMIPDIKLETAGGELAENGTQVNWYYSQDGTIFLPMTTAEIPYGSTKLKADITATSTEGTVKSTTITVGVEEIQTVEYTQLYNENFDGNNTQTSILAKQGGWDFGGNYSIDVGNYGMSTKSLRLSAMSWYKDNWMKLNFPDAGVAVPNGNIHFKCDLMFGTSTGENYDEEGKMHFKLQDASEHNIVEISVSGFDLNFVYGGKKYRLATGRENVFEKWNTVELFMDANKRVYTLLFNDKPVEIETGSRIPFDSSEITNVLMEHEWSNWWSYVCADNIQLDTYNVTEKSKFDITNVSILNSADENLEISTGAQVKGSCETAGSPLGSTIYEWMYSSNNTTWNKMTGNIIPDNAAKLKVIATAYSVYGQESSMEKVVNVVNNQRPKALNLTLNGSIGTGQVVTLNYDFTDDQADDNSTFSWYWGDDKFNYTKIENANGKSYTIPENNIGKYLKVVVQPIDKFLLNGTSMEYIEAYDDQALVDGVGYLFTIDTQPSGNVINLPAKSDVFAADIYWSSSDTKIISNSGVISRPSYCDKTVVLTATIVPSGKPQSYATSCKKRFSIRIVGSKGTKEPTSIGGGGGGGGSTTSSAGSVTTIASPEVAVIPQRPSGFKDVGKDFWGFSYIESLSAKGIIDKTAGEFRPNDYVTRAEFVKMLVLSLSLIDDKAKCDYTDISRDNWAYPYVASAKALGIVNGLSDGSFGLEQQITRQDMAVMLNRAIKNIQIPNKETAIEFIDKDNISQYAKESITSVVSKEIMIGNENYFKPMDNATRAECAKVISKIMEL